MAGVRKRSDSAVTRTELVVTNVEANWQLVESGTEEQLGRILGDRAFKLNDNHVSLAVPAGEGLPKQSEEVVSRVGIRPSLLEASDERQLLLDPCLALRDISIGDSEVPCLHRAVHIDVMHQTSRGRRYVNILMQSQTRRH